MYNVVKEISKKKNLDKNLKTFGNYMSDMYYRFAKVCLSMNYFTYFQHIALLWLSPSGGYPRRRKKPTLLAICPLMLINFSNNQ